MTATEEAPLLELRGLHKSFGPVQALADVNLDIPAGKVTALVGDNGAGKSVLIRTVSGIHQPDRGEILWEGRPRRIRTPRDAAALGIETVYQDLALADNLDIVQNMFLGRERIRRRLLDEESMETSAGETLAGLSVTTVRSVRQPVASLSGGQRQAVAIAKAVLWNSAAGDHGRADRGASAWPRRRGARARAPSRRPWPRRAHRLPQPERRVRGRRPDRGPLSRPPGRSGPGERVRPGACRRLHHVGSVETARRTWRRTRDRHRSDAGDRERPATVKADDAERRVATCSPRPRWPSARDRGRTAPRVRPRPG